ncbi:MAG: hypothetical protein AB7V13_03980 [Pseudorhodoplanes sp.]|uniref:hypothetical protein n=1 Tax=Pseudorhodoplanes sp. TaxID=1934341 RepID=UPI003D145F4D
MTQSEKNRSVSAADELEELEASTTIELDEVIDKCRTLEINLVDVAITGSGADRKMIREELRIAREDKLEKEALLAALPERIKEARQRESMAALDLKHPEAKELLKRELALYVDLYKFSSKLMATLEELGKTTPLLARLNTEFSSAGRRDLCVPSAEAILRGKTGMASNYRPNAILNFDAFRDVTRAFGLEVLVRDFDKGNFSL